MLSYYSAGFERLLHVRKQPLIQMKNTPRETLKFVLEWIITGGYDSNRKGAIPYPTDIVDLICLHKVATNLDIGPLIERTTQSIANHG